LAASWPQRATLVHHRVLNSLGIPDAPSAARGSAMRAIGPDAGAVEGVPQGGALGPGGGESFMAGVVEGWHGEGSLAS
jgi:hypothetical protein